MGNDIEKQKDLIVGAVLNLRLEFKALEYMLDEAKDPQNANTIDIFDQMFDFIYRLIWNSLVIQVCWLYDKKGQRGLYWYLKEQEKIPSKAAVVVTQITEIEKLEDTLKKFRKIRNKWIAHHDEHPFKNPEEFWAGENRPTLEEVKNLVETAHRIIQEHFPVTDLKDSGIYKLFGFTKLMEMKCENFNSIISEYKF